MCKPRLSNKRPQCVGPFGTRGSASARSIRWRIATLKLIAIVNRGEFSLNGFRNRDVRFHLYGVTEDKAKERRQMAAVGRRLRLLRAHGLIAKVSKTHRYVVTEKGREVITALLAARQASTEQLTALAA
jgi:hypothetical protein